MQNNIKRVAALIGIMFFIIGIVFLGIGCYNFISHKDFMERAEKTDAVITDISYERRRINGRTDRRHIVTIEYTVDGVGYEREITEYKPDMYEGKIIEIYYDPYNPNNVKTDSLMLPVTFAGFGALFVIIGSSFILVKIISSVRRKNLMTNGDVLNGIITNVNINMSVRINGRHPYRAECEVIDPIDGSKYLYSSPNITEDISKFIGMEVTVYADKNNRKRYYVDINQLIKKYNSDNNIYDYR